MVKLLTASLTGSPVFSIFMCRQVGFQSLGFQASSIPADVPPRDVVLVLEDMTEDELEGPVSGI